jgi:hypothetical protein
VPKTLSRSIPILTTAIVFLLSFGAVAHAAAAVEPVDGSLLDLFRPVYEAFLTGHYMYAGSVSLVFAVALARRYGKNVAWMHTDAGAAVLALLGSFGAAMAASLAGGSGPTLEMAWRALTIAFGAAGSYAVVKATIIRPYLAHLANKGPAWVHAPAEWLLWVFQEQLPARDSATSDASQDAQKKDQP